MAAENSVGHREDTRTEQLSEKLPYTSDSMPPENVHVGSANARRDHGQNLTLDTEFTTSKTKKLTYLGIYLSFNMFLTMYNKLVLGQFAFPWLLTTLHASSASIGCYGLLGMGYFKVSRLSSKDILVMSAFSFLFTVNIAVSNISLAMVSVPFHQIMRSSCPVVSIMIYRFYFHRQYPTMTYMAVTPIVFGAALAAYGDVHFTHMGLFFTLLGVVLASVKTVVSNRLMTGSLALPPLELLLRMSPLAAMQSLIFSVMTGEFAAFQSHVAAGKMSTGTYVALAGNGLLAFLLNISSFQSNKLAGAVTMTICANVKQCLTVGLSVLIFHVQVGAINGIGMLTALAGAAWYSKVELDRKGGTLETPATPRVPNDEEAQPLQPGRNGPSA